ncbi:hypothetical protein MSIMFB_02406 [Mycobacterium simulans]|uniref:Transmembrane protein n=1 Tax=Mycobacterium simulans TaxID=627089 RepID=A0A7Z7N9M7_9MYCO|nr:hypothetical protein [Mycobacterium simulans]SOJ54915.1 hypothetical protein MSIMFB_02406 [Mycobacterium simulans]
MCRNQIRNDIIPNCYFAVMVAERLQRMRTWCSTTTWGSARWQQALAAVIAALTIAPHSSVDAGVGLDPSWEAVVALAPVRHILWGPDLVFTYGPLGYLQTTAYYAFDQSILATVYQFAVVAALFLGIAAVLRQRCAPMTSLIGAFFATGLAAILQVGHGTSLGMMYPELVILASLAWASVPMLQQDPKRSTIFVTCTVLGAVAGLQLLVKFNTGLTVLVLALAASMLLGWRAVIRHCATLAAFAASTLFWWVLAGQQLGDLPGWFRFSADILSGYNESQAVPLTRYAVPAILLSLAWIAVLCVIFMRGGPQIPRGFALLVGLLTLITLKSAFGRFDIYHLSMLLGVIVVAVALAPGVRIRQRAWVLTAVVFVFAFNYGAPQVGQRVVAAVQGPVQSIDRLITLAVPGRVEQRIARAKARQRATDAVPERFIKAIGSQTVHVDPDETSVVWAYDLAWRPAPVFATYSAYTPSLDKLNSDALAASVADGPAFVLSRVSAKLPATGIDNRLGIQESPLYSRALLCNYTLSGVENHWALFTHSRPRCGPLTPLSEVHVDNNNSVSVPTPSRADMAILVAVDLEPTIVDRIFQGTLAPLTTFTVVLDGFSYRLIAKNAAEPFLVVSPASVNGTNLDIHAHTIGVGRTEALGQDGVHARLRFFEMGVGS